MTTNPNCPRCGAPWKEFQIGFLKVSTWDCEDENCGKPPQTPLTPEWQMRLPALFHAADPLKVSPLLRGILSWKPTPETNGMAIIGPSRAGKSFAVACAAKAWTDRFRWVNARTKLAPAYTDLTSDNLEDRSAALTAWKIWEIIPILVLDDLDKANWTAEFAARLYGLLEARIQSRLKTIWTANAMPPTMRMADGTPSALANRLMADCLVIDLTKK